jgi:hypothetical protein
MFYKTQKMSYKLLIENVLFKKNYIFHYNYKTKRVEEVFDRSTYIIFFYCQQVEYFNQINFKTKS